MEGEIRWDKVRKPGQARPSFPTSPRHCQLLQGVSTNTIFKKLNGTSWQVSVSNKTQVVAPCSTPQRMLCKLFDAVHPTSACPKIRNIKAREVKWLDTPQRRNCQTPCSERQITTCNELWISMNDISRYIKDNANDGRVWVQDGLGVHIQNFYLRCAHWCGNANARWNETIVSVSMILNDFQWLNLVQTLLFHHKDHKDRNIPQWKQLGDCRSLSLSLTCDLCLCDELLPTWAQYCLKRLSGSAAWRIMEDCRAHGRSVDALSSAPRRVRLVSAE